MISSVRRNWKQINQVEEMVLESDGEMASSVLNWPTCFLICGHDTQENHVLLLLMV